MRLLQSFNNSVNSSIDVSFRAINIKLILEFLGFICKRNNSLKRRLQRLRLTALPTFLLAITVKLAGFGVEDKKKAMKLLDINFTP